MMKERIGSLKEPSETIDHEDISNRILILNINEIN